MYSDILTVNEAAKRLKKCNLNVSARTLRRWIKCNELPGVRFTGTRALIYFPSLLAYLTHSETKGDNNDG